MNEFRGTTGRAGGEIFRVYKGDGQTPKGRFPRHPGARDAPTNDEEVKALPCKASQLLSSSLTGERRGHCQVSLTFCLL